MAGGENECYGWTDRERIAASDHREHSTDVSAHRRMGSRVRRIFNGSAPAVFGRENRSALSGTCALRKETKNRGICLSQSAGAAFIFYRGHFDDRIASAQKSVCGADGNPDRDR